LSGTIPDAIGAGWPALQFFFIGANRFESMLPESVGLWENLLHAEIGVDGTTAERTGNINGNLPDSIGNWTKLQYFSANGLQSLTGTIPESVRQWTDMKEFWVRSSGLSGEVPSSVVNWSGAISILLNDTDLEGSIPRGLCDIANLTLVADCVSEITCECCTMCF